MAQTAYHQEALRQQRMIDRKYECRRKLENIGKQNDAMKMVAAENERRMIEERMRQQNRTHTACTHRTSHHQLPSIQHRKAHSAPHYGILARRTPWEDRVPMTVRNVQRDYVYSIMHPYCFVEYSKKPWDSRPDPRMPNTDVKPTSLTLYQYFGQ